jgi:hypothetical protein
MTHEMDIYGKSIQSTVISKLCKPGDVDAKRSTAGRDVSLIKLV